MKISTTIATLANFVSIIITTAMLAGCSDNSSNEQVERTTSPAIETDQASRAISLATQSSERVKATFSIYYADAIATEEALKNYYEYRKNWPLIFDDTFDDNRNEWPLEEDDDDLASVSWKIEDGKYMWDALAKQGFIYWTYPSVPIATDFTLSVDAQQVEGPYDGQYGLVFRLLDENNYYLFLIDQDKNYSFDLYNEGEWFTLDQGTISPAVMQNDENRISVIGEKITFRVYINDIFINETIDQTLTSGKFGIAIGLTYPQDRAVFEFDNFELRSPEMTDENE
jgi:hypothetical protein